MEGQFSIEEHNTPKFSIKLTWVLAGFATASCIIRNDYNVLFSFLILIILNRYFEENTKYYSKILIHLLLALSLADILWLIIILPYWNSKSTSNNPYWESLAGVHTFVIILAFVELILKGVLAGLIFLQYKKSHPNDIKELFKPSYSMPAPIAANRSDVKEIPDSSARSD